MTQATRRHCTAPIKVDIQLSPSRLIGHKNPKTLSGIRTKLLTGWQRGWNPYGQSVKASEPPKRYQRLFLGLLTIMIVAITVVPCSPLSTPEKVALTRTYLFWGRSTQTFV